MSYQPLAVTLPDWEGPLDLLLHVIRTHKLDVLDIPIAFVTEQYLSYLDEMEALNLDIAAEYLEMAATLAHIKSRMMLPTQSDMDEELPEEEADPREELVRRLLEYQRYKDAANKLEDQPRLGRDTFAVGHQPQLDIDGEAPLVELGLFDLAEAFRCILERTKAPDAHKVSFERITISERIGEIVEILRPQSLTPFDELFQGVGSRSQVVITLLALLEMTRLHMTRLLQASVGGPLYVTLGGPRPGLRAIPGSSRQTGEGQAGQPWKRKSRPMWRLRMRQRRRRQIRPLSPHRSPKPRASRLPLTGRSKRQRQFRQLSRMR